MLQILCVAQDLDTALEMDALFGGLTLLELALVAQIPDELVGAMVELIELVPLLQIHAATRIALNAADALSQLTVNAG